MRVSQLVLLEALESYGEYFVADGEVENAESQQELDWQSLNV